MTATASLQARTAAPDRAATRVARHRLLRALLIAGAWFWAIWAVFVAGVPMIVDRWGGEAEGLTYDMAGAPARWVAFGVGAVVSGTRLRLHVAAGGTRRSLVRGAAQAAAIAGPASGVLAVLLTLGEERVYAWLDRFWQGGATPLPLDAVTGVVLAIVAETLVIVTYALSAVAVVAVYRTRWAMLGPLPALPLLVPCVLVDLATRTGVFGIPLRGGYDDVALGVVLTVVGGLAAAALASFAAHRTVQVVQIRP